MSTPETIAADVVVLFHYTLKNGDGEVLDQSDPSEPLPYLHGHDNIVDGLEAALVGLKVGDSKQVEVAPEDGYGVADEDAIQEVSRDSFPPDAQLEAGVGFMAEQDDGTMVSLFVQAIEGDTVFVTTNHPLAGVTLHFDVTITDLRAATDDELEHGHPHGPGGHHH